MKNIFLLLVVFIMLFGSKTFSQTTITLNPSVDAEVWSLQPNSFFNSILLRANAWTFDGTPGQQRGYFNFDLTSIPAGAVIQSAFLSLFAPDSPSTEFDNPQSGPNDAWLKRVTGAWYDNTITWDNQPNSTSQNAVSLPASTKQYQDYLDIDVKQLIVDMINNSGSSYGFMLQLKTEEEYRRLSFCASNYSNTAKHPKLIITYKLIDCVTLNPTTDAEVWSLQPNSFFNSTLLRANAWTFDGTPGQQRGYFNFDLTSIPAGAVIQSAFLSLFAPDSPSTEFDNPQSGPNDAWLKRVTGAWYDNTITWDNQPNSTSQNAVTLPASTKQYQDYLDIDVKQLIVDMINNSGNSYGFMLQLKTEEEYRRLSFCASNYSNTTKHPKLVVCYLVPSGIHSINSIKFLSLYPNPFSSWLNLSTKEFTGSDLTISIYNLMGQNIFSNHYRENEFSGQLDLSFLESGSYIISVSSKNYSLRNIIIKE